MSSASFALRALLTSVFLMLVSFFVFANADEKKHTFFYNLSAFIAITSFMASCFYAIRLIWVAFT